MTVLAPDCDMWPESAEVGEVQRAKLHRVGRWGKPADGVLAGEAMREHEGVRPGILGDRACPRKVDKIVLAINARLRAAEQNRTLMLLTQVCLYVVAAPPF